MAKKPAYQKKIAEERIHILFEEADKAFDEHPERSDRYVELARKIAMKFNLSMPNEVKEKFCPECYAYWVPGETVKVRLKNGNRVMTCEECGEVARRPYKD